jgi:hypothetical protein
MLQERLLKWQYRNQKPLRWHQLPTPESKHGSNGSKLLGASAYGFTEPDEPEDDEE